MRRFAGDQADLMKLLGCLPTAQMPGRISYRSPRWGHVNLTRLDAVCIEREIKQTEDLIGPLDNGTKVFRPPFGFHNGIVDRAAEALGYKSVFWNLCAWDWRPYYQNRRWVSHIVRRIAAGRDGIILAHDVFASTVAHVPELIAAIRDLPDIEFDLVA